MDIVFSKNGNTGEYTPLVLLGLEENENLFISNGLWDALYIPLCAEAQPFLIGQGQSGQSDNDQNWVIHVDLDSPKLDTESGTNLFREFGGNSPFLDRICEILGAVHEGISEVKPFTDILEKYNLLEPFAVETTLKNNRKCKFQGFHVINEDRLAELSAEDIASLHASGFLFDIHMQIASLSNFSTLFDRKNKTL